MATNPHQRSRRPRARSSSRARGPGSPELRADRDDARAEHGGRGELGPAGASGGRFVVLGCSRQRRAPAHGMPLMCRLSGICVATATPPAAVATAAPKPGRVLRGWRALSLCRRASGTEVAKQCVTLSVWLMPNRYRCSCRVQCSPRCRLLSEQNYELVVCAAAMACTGQLQALCLCQSRLALPTRRDTYARACAV